MIFDFYTFSVPNLLHFTYLSYIKVQLKKNLDLSVFIVFLYIICFRNNVLWILGEGLLLSNNATNGQPHVLHQDNA